MKRLLLLLTAILVSLSVLTACGKPQETSEPAATEPQLTRAETIMQRYSEIANAHTALNRSIVSASDKSAAGAYSSLAIELTDLATELHKNGETMSDEELDAISAELDKIETELNAIKTSLGQ